jgi:hypothetical protein
MSSVILTGDTSGTLTVSAPLVAGSNTVTLPAATGTISLLTQATAVASTSGTSIDFTGIPSWAKRITVMFSGVSTNGASTPLIQIGTGGTPTTSGYVSSSSQLATAAFITSYTSGYLIYSNNAGYIGSGSVTITNVSGNIWVASGVLANTAVSLTTYTTAGTVTLGGTLNMVRITTSGGTDTFDAGSINVMWEG